MSACIVVRVATRRRFPMAGNRVDALCDTIRRADTLGARSSRAVDVDGQGFEKAEGCWA
jgi:hypothetical protein